VVDSLRRFIAAPCRRAVRALCPCKLARVIVIARSIRNTSQRLEWFDSWCGFEISVVKNQRLGDGGPNGHRTGPSTLPAESLAGGRTWWAHLEFRPVVIELTMVKKELEDLREVCDR
jgi:hypothetical protein